MASSKREAFLRLAERRTNVVLEKIRILSNCSNRYAYEYTEEDIRRMFAAIETEARLARAKFQVRTPRPTFRLGSDQEGGDRATKPEAQLEGR